MKYILAILALVLGITVAVFVAPRGPEASPIGQTPLPQPVFTWQYSESDLNADGLPRTRISLEATYADGESIVKEIDIVDGSCNAVDPQEDDTDLLAGTTKIQCYAAGLGEWYKIVQGDGSYAVRRKIFEETSPDQEPPQHTYENIAEFPVRTRSQ